MPTIHDMLHMLPATLSGECNQEGCTVDLPSISIGVRHLFGGQVFAQALRSAQFWLAQQQRKMHVHMIHGVFLKAGTAQESVQCRVVPLGRGRTFQRLQVQVWQKNALVFQAMVSAQVIEPCLIEHQQSMPSVVGPTDLMTDQQLRATMTGQQPESLARPFEIRVSTPAALMQRQTAQEHYGFWFRYTGAQSLGASLLTPDHSQALLAYISDYGFLTGLFVPHSPKIRATPFFLTSLDHSLWYYGDYEPFKWAYFDIQSPVAAHGRGVVTGRLYQDSNLIALATQEGLLRRRD